MLAAIGEGRERETASAVAWLDLHILVLGAGVACYALWRTSRDTTTGWIAAALVGTALSGTPFAIVDLAAVGPRSGATGDATGVILYAPVLLLVAFACGALSVPRRLPPLAVGITWGSVVLVLRMAYPWLVDHPVTLPQPWGAIIGVSVGTGFLGACTWINRGRSGLSSPDFFWVTLALLTSLLLSPVGTAGGTLQSWYAVVALVLISAGLACSATKSLVASLADDTSHHPSTWPVHALPMQARLREDELFHELRSTVADISTASQLLSRNDDRLTDSHRQRLSSGLAAEAARLTRLVNPPESVTRASVSLDHVLEPLVDCQRANGHDIRWEPSGHVVLGTPDDVSEIVHILLHNALRHAPGTPVEVTVHQRSADVEIRVTDSGPGIPPALRRSLFERGTRGADSPGSGIGLFLARRLASEHGGQLQLRHNRGRSGASFVLTLPSSQGEIA